MAEKSVQVVQNVHAFPGHIACDSDSLSEVVVPLVVNDSVVGVLDVDSPCLNGFTEADVRALTQVASILQESCDWSELLN